LTNLGTIRNVLRARMFAYNLAGVILADGLSVLTALFLLWRTQRKRAAVGRRYDNVPRTLAKAITDA
jgi:hypothetical protein